MAESALRPSQLARSAGVNTATLRYYGRRGLLPEPPRAPNGYRLYPASAVRLIRFIKRAQEVGFTLREIQEFLEVAADPRADCGSVCGSVEQKLAEVELRVRELRLKGRRLRELLRSCPGDVPVRDCPILGALAGAGAPRLGPVNPKKKGGDVRR